MKANEEEQKQNLHRKKTSRYFTDDLNVFKIPITRI